MTQQRRIRYATDSETGQVWSQVFGEGLAVPILNYEKIGEGGDFSLPLTYTLEKLEGVLALSALVEAGDRLTWTRRIPGPIKNEHRELWGMKMLN